MRQRRFAKASRNKGNLSTVSARIDVRNLRLLLHPKWNKSPPCHYHLALAITGIDADDWDLVGWSDVVAEGKVRLGRSLGFEEPSIGITRDEIVVPPTHCQ